MIIIIGNILGGGGGGGGGKASPAPPPPPPSFDETLMRVHGVQSSGFRVHNLTTATAVNHAGSRHKVAVREVA